MDMSNEISADPHLSYWRNQKHDSYHMRQFETPYRSTVRLAEFIRATIGAPPNAWRALDVCCGMGANAFFLSKQFPSWTWTGVDIVEDVLDAGRDIMLKQGEERSLPKLVKGDAFDLAGLFAQESFQVVLSIQSLLCMPDYDLTLDNLFAMCSKNGWIFISSLFADFSVDVRMQITEYPESNFANPVGPAIYNIYSLPKFRSDCMVRGARRVEAVDFAIDIDLPIPAHGQMGTYTVKLADQKRLQASGPILMPWKFVAIQKS